MNQIFVNFKNQTCEDFEYKLFFTFDNCSDIDLVLFVIGSSVSSPSSLFGTVSGSFGTDSFFDDVEISTDISETLSGSCWGVTNLAYRKKFDRYLEKDIY